MNPNEPIYSLNDLKEIQEQLSKEHAFQQKVTRFTTCVLAVLLVPVTIPIGVSLVGQSLFAFLVAGAFTGTLLVLYEMALKNTGALLNDYLQKRREKKNGSQSDGNSDQDSGTGAQG